MAKKIKAEVKPKPVVVKRYSDEKLAFFKENVLFKLEEAKKSRDFHLDILRGNSNGTDDTSSSFNDLEDGNISLSKERAQHFYDRAMDIIPKLEGSLIRIENKTYGICCETGELISEERLVLVPHTTRSIVGKNIQAGNTPPRNVIFNRELPNHL